MSIDEVRALNRAPGRIAPLKTACPAAAHPAVHAMAPDIGVSLRCFPLVFVILLDERCCCAERGKKIEDRGGAVLDFALFGLWGAAIRASGV